MVTLGSLVGKEVGEARKEGLPGTPILAVNRAAPFICFYTLGMRFLDVGCTQGTLS